MENQDQLGNENQNSSVVSVESPRPALAQAAERMTWRYNQRAVSVSFCCNDPDSGMCTSRFCSVEIGSACDYAPTLKMMEIAFREIARLHSEHPHLVSSQKTARQTLIVSELCRRLHDDDYHELAKGAI